MEGGGKGLRLYGSCYAPCFDWYGIALRSMTSRLRVQYFAAADISRAGSGAFEQVKLQLLLAFRRFLE